MLMIPWATGYLWYVRESEVIVEGVQVNGLDLAGYSPEQALQAVQQRYEGYLLQPLALVAKDFRPSFIPKEVGFELDAGVVAEAFRLGHEGNLFQRVVQRLALRRRPRNLPLRFKTDTETLNNFFRLELQLNQEPVRARVFIDRQGRVYKLPARSVYAKHRPIAAGY